MNYVGSVSIIDRGDAPAKAVIDKNTRSLAQRVADETKEELDKVMDRVDNVMIQICVYLLFNTFQYLYIYSKNTLNWTPSI